MSTPAPLASPSALSVTIRAPSSSPLAMNKVKIIGVEPSDVNAMALSLHTGERVMLNQVGGFADGVVVKTVGEETFCMCRELVDGVVIVSCDAICASIKILHKLQAVKEESKPLCSTNREW